MSDPIGFIVMMAPKNHRDTNFLAPLAYGFDDVQPSPDLLLRDRGATMFSTRKAALEAIKHTCGISQENGHEWVKARGFYVVEVRADKS